MIEIVSEDGVILGLLSKDCAMPVRRRHGDTLRVWLRQPPPTTAMLSRESSVADIAGIEVRFRWHEVRWGYDRVERTYSYRWYAIPVDEITDEQWKMDPGSLVRIKWK